MAQIQRLHDAEISDGQDIIAEDLDDEFNQLTNESNSQDTRLTTLESGTITISGTKTFSGGNTHSGNNTFSGDNTFSGANTFTGAINGIPPAGSLLLYGGAAAPTGYLLCYGQAVSRTTYADLFTAISTTFGTGDGSTTFNVPDLRGRVPLGKDNMGGSAASRITSASTNGANSTTLGGAGGAQTHTLTTGEIPSISFTFPMGNSDAATANTGFADTADSDEYSGSTNSVGGGGAHSNTQPWIALNYIIKT